MNGGDPLDCEQMAELLAIEALEGPGPDKALIDAHCADCEECTTTREEYARVASLLVFALPDTAASPQVRERLRFRMALARPREQRGWRRPALAAGAIAAALLIGGFVGAWVATTTDGGDANQPAVTVPAATERYALRAAAAGPGSSGELVIDRSAGTAVVEMQNLPALDASQVYQFWFLMRDGTRLDGATFPADEYGNAWHKAPLPQDAQSVAGAWVTVEPAPGSVTPRGPNVLIVRFP